jgi:ferritin-like metal-binding protein YciE
MTGKDLFVAWLNDAYGMENALIKVLEHQIKDAKDFPPIQAKLEQHLEQTKRHAELVKGCVENLGGHTSTVKTGISKLFGQMQALSTGPAHDELMKNALADYAAENFEIASYTALIRAAQELGEQETARVCQQLLRDEEEMAQWLQQQLPTLVQQSLLQTTR